MSEVNKLKQYCEDNEVTVMGVTTSYDLGLTDKKPTAEEIAAELNRVHEWLSDPVNNLTSSISGHIMLKKNTIMCLENRKRVISEDLRIARCSGATGSGSATVLAHPQMLRLLGAKPQTRLGLLLFTTTSA